MNVDPELRKRVERIKSSPVQLYREAGDYSNRELVEGILVRPDDIAAIEAVAREEELRPARFWQLALAKSIEGLVVGDAWEAAAAIKGRLDSRGVVLAVDEAARREMLASIAADEDSAADDPHHRMVQPDHYQRWER
jgi:hypothetical protein